MLRVLRQRKNFLLATLLLIVFGILLVDGVNVFLDKRKAQNAADTAALVAALAQVREEDYRRAAIARAASNGYDNDGTSNAVQVQNPPILGPYTGDPDYIQVIITSQITTNILRIKRENRVDAVVHLPPKCIACEPPAIQLTNGDGPVTPTAPDLQAAIRAEFATIEELLKESVHASLAYNQPEAMNVDETVTIELLLNPSISAEQLRKQVTESGSVSTGQIEVTPRMKAYLYTHDRDALEVQPLQDNPEQLVSDSGTTKWNWSVKAMKGGTYTLTLKIFRLIQYEEEEFWREVEAYDSKIQVKVSLAHAVKTMDWKWVLPTLATALLIPYFWRWYDSRKEQDPKENQKPTQRRQDARSKKTTIKKKLGSDKDKPSE